MAEDILAGHAERIQQRRHRQLALAIDTDVDDVLGVEFEIEPRPAIGDDARGEEILARMRGSCQRSWSNRTPGDRCIWLTITRSVPLMKKVPLPVHQGHVAHVDVLLLDIDDRLGFGVGIDLERGQAQRDAPSARHR